MNDICVICQEDLCGNIYELPECGHKYHTNCIMHWFRSKHDNCPLCQNHGINYAHSLQEANNGHYIGRRIWSEYYTKAAAHTRKKEADPEIVKRVKSIKKSIEKQKQTKLDFKIWKDEISGIKSNKEVHKQYLKFRDKIWRFHRDIWKRKVAIGYLYYHKFHQNKLIIAEKVNV